MECAKSFQITVDPASVCAVSQGNVTYVTLPGTTFLLEVVASNDNANRAMVLGISGADYYTAFFNTNTDTEISVVNEGAVPHAQGMVYTAVNQAFWFITFDGSLYNTIFKYSKDGVFLGSQVLTIANLSNNSGNINNVISYEPSTQLIYAFPDSDGLSNNDDMLLIFNPATNAVSSQLLDAVSNTISGGSVLACPGFIFVTGMTSMVGQTFFNIYTVPAFALVATIDLSVGNWGGGFAYAPNTGKVYFAEDSSALIHEINPNNGVTDFTYNLIGQTQEIKSIVYDPIQGRLIAFDGIGAVATINPISRTVVCIETTTAGVYTYTGAAIDSNLGKAYGNLSGFPVATEIWQ